MRSSPLFILLALPLLVLGCSEEATPEQVKNLQIRQEIETTISEIEAKTRTKAGGLGMANAESSTIDDVRAYVCNALIGKLKEVKDADAREGVATDLTTYACREREEWLSVLRATAKGQGLEGSDAATLSDTRDFICDRIKESLRAVKKPRDKQTLETEGRVYDCVF